LARLSAHLTATARAWNRLPPVFSNRGGVTGRLELWIKSRLKSLTRWFTWEQVNFNAAVHHSLSETLELLSAQKQELIRLQAELDKATSALDKKEREIQGLRVRLDAQSTEMRARRDNEEREREREIRARLSEIDLRLAELAQNLREEQRVCFKQLALEISETAVLEDRCRRNLESRLEQLESAAISNKAKGTSTS
jgi:capsule polysaccharide export protein KpsE/RkpR